ncbi:hypothetical protein H696_06227 [Fonticula alba]|uniref:tRNA (guanine(26)-N(2))-dimethyltransferase n=1 Tax=Fonticula alba TaxID=691883 RepID=A0A058YZC2_FONAL|nr:hypothetical protein H696_06227 [Fonticula alba]KCV67345.1 hypothetical protein H696_06227 [Fonticula alba]|eukprot:XP_009498248.1 hypothetical protein H696_06227 [Fonticula alba]
MFLRVALLRVARSSSSTCLSPALALAFSRPSAAAAVAAVATATPLPAGASSPVSPQRFFSSSAPLSSVRRPRASIPAMDAASSASPPTPSPAIGDYITPAAELVPITEGSATVLFPTAAEVFYNPAQVINRDISISAIRTFVALRRMEERDQAKCGAGLMADVLPAQADRLKRITQTLAEVAPESGQAGRLAALEGLVAGGEGPVTVLEALSASGLRAARYAREIPGLTRIVANDLSRDAVLSIDRNIAHNRVEHLVSSNLGDANVVMQKHASDGFTIVDLDPYGTAIPFLDAAMGAIESGGMMLVTCTDMAVLAGSNPDSCYSKYGTMPVNGRYCHELALRILLDSLSAYAAKHRRYIVPLVSLSIDFYIRVFIRVFRSASEVKLVAQNSSSIYQCSACPSFHTAPNARPLSNKHGQVVRYGAARPPTGDQSFCESCGRPAHVGGPIWTGPLHNQDFIHAMLAIVEATPPYVEPVPDATDAPAAAQANAATDAGTGTPSTPEPELPITSFAKPLRTRERIIGMLNMALEELPDVPLYYTLSDILGTVSVSGLPMTLARSALLNAGYRVSGSHAARDALKTDAPQEFIWRTVRAWARHHYKVRFSKASRGKPTRALLMARIDQEAVAKAALANEQAAEARAQKLARLAERQEAGQAVSSVSSRATAIETERVPTEEEEEQEYRARLEEALRAEKARLARFHMDDSQGLVSRLEAQLAEPWRPVNFDLHPEAEPHSRRVGLTRFAVLPAGWGPMARARVRMREAPGEDIDEQSEQEMEHEQQPAQ